MQQNKSEQSRQYFMSSYEQAEHAIHERFVELQAKYEDLQRMKREFEANFTGRPTDRLNLNCGGCEMTVERGVLTHFKRTAMAALFSGRYDAEIDRDSKDRIFLDLDPNAFNSLVEYLAALRDGRARVNESHLMAPIDQHANIDALIDHFKLRPYLTGVVDDNDQVRMKRRKTVLEGSDRPSLEEIKQRSQFLGPVIEAFEKLAGDLFEEERRVQKWDEEEEWETIYEFDRFFAELYKRQEQDPIEYINSLQVQFMCKRSTMKLSEFLYNLQRNRRGEVILTNPGSIVNKILEYLRRRKIRLDDNHVGDLYVEEGEWQFFHDTVRSFGILEDIQLRADLMKFTKGSKPQPMRLALPSSSQFGRVVHMVTTTRTPQPQGSAPRSQQPPRSPQPNQTQNYYTTTTTTNNNNSVQPQQPAAATPLIQYSKSQNSTPQSQPQQPQVIHLQAAPQQQQQQQVVYTTQQVQQQPQMVMVMQPQQVQQQPQPSRPEGWSGAQWSAYQANNQDAYTKWYQEQQSKQYAGMTPQEAWARYYAAQASKQR